VASNPPYVEPGDLGSLQPEVRDWEPEQALVGHGVTEQIARGARQVLRANAALVLEVADGTAREVASLLAELGYSDVAATPDLAGRDRVVEGRWTP
jgi:release factor glutamine methyltransferase